MGTGDIASRPDSNLVPFSRRVLKKFLNVDKSSGRERAPPPAMQVLP
jgi:hypothetical protein